MPKENSFQLITTASDKPSIRWAGKADPVYSFHVRPCIWDSGLILHNAWYLPPSGGRGGVVPGGCGFWTGLEVTSGMAPSPTI